jgi:hypothetical protein
MYLLVDEMKKVAAKKKGRGFDAGGQKSSVREYESLGGEGDAGAPQRMRTALFCRGGVMQK